MSAIQPQVWRVNVRTRNLERSKAPQSWERLGGRGLIARILVDEVDAACDPLGPSNKLIFSPGLLVGHKLTSMDRISIGAKSPLTGGVKESNAGGRTGYHMAALGIKVLILEDLPQEQGFSILYLSRDGARWVNADHITGLGVYDTAERLIEQFGKNVAIALIGPGGEMQMKASGIQNIDKDRVPSRIAARGGLGAVMGAKCLKAIVFDDSCTEKPAIIDPFAFETARKDYTKCILDHPQSKVYKDYGTSAMAQMCNSFGALPTRNFSSGMFEKVEDISGETLRDFILERGKPSDPSHACMAGCVIKCSNVFGGEDGHVIVSALEYETLGLMGSNLGITSLDNIGRLNWEVNDLGLDSIEIGAALGVAAEAGLMNFGDASSALKILDEIRKGSEVGRSIGDGAASTGQKFNIDRVPVVKRQAMSAYEPRAIKGTGVTYATSPQGADHTCGLTIRAKVNHLDPLVQMDVSRNGQYTMAGIDTIGACLMAGFGISSSQDGVIRRLLVARYGWQDLPQDVIRELGKQTTRLEREFNRMAGFTEKDDRLPEYMTREPLPPHNTVFDVPKEMLDHIFDELDK